jgi:hypothetical protein
MDKDKQKEGGRKQKITLAGASSANWSSYASIASDDLSDNLIVR